MEKLKKKPAGRILLYVVLLVVALGIMFSLRRCRQWGESGKVDTDTLRVAIQYAPGSFYYDNDSIKGRDYEALQQLGMPFRIYPITNPAEGLKGLREHRYDLVIADLPQTADSAKEYIFTDPIYLDRQVLVQCVDSAGATPAITSPLQLGGQAVTVPEGSPMAARLYNLSREIGDTIHVVERPVNAERLLTELALGADSVNLTVANSTLAQEIAEEFPGRLNYSVPISLTQFQSWVLLPSEVALRDSINARLRR
ncbi:MAG: transporter substrate-binding domain-containing protein [Bacteroides sp.]|nr:transporter substrate-binding domain-containing protein [Bacteroides sp.]MCM1378887.1 transporter substrate-binding domain-containing protein [Bacteroides sp.]MCM1445503.1 transporter substrate-binding domain-containing protein [Prevotella sp.]